MSATRSITWQGVVPTSSSSSSSSAVVSMNEIIMELMNVTAQVLLGGGTNSIISWTRSSSSSSSSFSLSRSIQNQFTQTHETVVGIGLTGMVRLLCNHTELLAESNSIIAAQQESWMRTAEQTLWSWIQTDKKDDAAFQRSTIEQFAADIEQHLFTKDQTVLVGDVLSMADVLVAVLLAGAVTTTTTSPFIKLPQQTFRWIQMTLHALRDAVQCAHFSGSMAKTIAVWCDTLTEGDASPLEKPVTVVTTVATAPAPAPVSVVVPDTTSKKEHSTPTDPVPVASPAPPPTTTSTPATSSVVDITKLPNVTAPPGQSSTDNVILALLDQLHLPYRVYDHALCQTAEELVTNVPLSNNETHCHTKNLFLRDKKYGLFLVTVRPSIAVNTKTLGQMLHLTGKTNLRLADEVTLNEYLHVKTGCVGPLCMGLTKTITTTTGHDGKDEKITFAIDAGLINNSSIQYIHSHPMRNDMSVEMPVDAFKTFFAMLDIEPVLLDFDHAAVSSPAPANNAFASATKQSTVETTTTTTTKQTPAGTAAGATSTIVVSKDKKTAKKGETLLALQWKKSENFPMWYSDIIVLSEMISYYDISGCYILRPWSYKMWELIQYWFNNKIEALGVENSYFPMFVSQERLEREKDHVEGFAPEVAWVTRSGSGELAKPIAVRPTSETIMYPAYSDWIKSHRDLPLKLNQWSNVVRWEFKYPTPFLRTREFLWQEGHTAHATFDDADEMVMQALELYRGVYEDLLAVPVIKGFKTEKEKFAGGFRTTTVEAYVAGSGRAIQGATSHNLGQNFGKMFDIKFQNEKGQSEIAWQTSWGLTTRTLGVMVMTHGDDTGLVLPPMVAPLQVVVVPIISKKLTSELADPYCSAIVAGLKGAGLRAKYDDRTIYNPGWKYNHWEQKGVPIRIEVGPRDIEQGSVRVVIRHDGEKMDILTAELSTALPKKLDEIQAAMFAKAKAARDSHVVQVTEWKDFVPELEKNNLVLTPWCGGEHKDWEEWVKKTSREESLKARGEDAEDEKTATSVAAKTLCIPFEQPVLPDGTKCIASGMPATCWCLWGRSY